MKKLIKLYDLKPMKTQDKTIVLDVKIGKFKMIYNSCTRRSNMNAMQW